MYSDFLNPGKDQASTSYGSIPNHAFDRPPGVDSLPISLREDNDDIESEWYMPGIPLATKRPQPSYGRTYRSSPPAGSSLELSLRQAYPLSLLRLDLG